MLNGRWDTAGSGSYDGSSARLRLQKNQTKSFDGPIFRGITSAQNEKIRSRIHVRQAVFCHKPEPAQIRLDTQLCCQFSQFRFVRAFANNHVNKPFTLTRRKAGDRMEYDIMPFIGMYARHSAKDIFSRHIEFMFCCSAGSRSKMPWIDRERDGFDACVGSYSGYEFARVVTIGDHEVCALHHTALENFPQRTQPPIKSWQ